MNLQIKKITIISEKNEVAKTVEFDKKLTVITSEELNKKTINRTGKSLLIKSIYHSLGAKLSKYTSNWNNLMLSTIVEFSLDSSIYKLYRQKNRFILINKNNATFYNNISNLRKEFVELFNFKIKMPYRKGDENSTYAYPGAFFMPFYIDQDKGWSGTWDSFADLFNTQWKKETLLYHLGVRTPKYYELLDERIKLEVDKNDYKVQEKTLGKIYQRHIKKYKDVIDINVNIEDYSEEISKLTDELNEQLDKRNLIKEKIVDCFNELRECEELYRIAEKVYDELIQDADYVENESMDKIIVCPVCGTNHENSMINRYKLYSEIEECEETISGYFDTKEKIEVRLEKQYTELVQMDDYISKINDILDKKRESITFRDVIVSEGSKSLLKDVTSEISEVQNEIIRIDSRMKEIRKDLTAITRSGSNITKHYLEKLSANLSMLNVNDIDYKELEKFKVSFNSGGNDLPCVVMAQVYALFATAKTNSKTIVSPIVFDAIYQQEPAPNKVDFIWDFIVNNQPEDSQLIISTTELHGKNFNGKTIRLSSERSLLNSQDYKASEIEISKFKDMMIKYLKEVD